jgi:nicotinamidase-related amidase
MAMKWWMELFPKEELQVFQSYQKSLLEPVVPEGRRPALLVIDVTRAFTGERGQTMAESLRAWPTSCGPAAWLAMPLIEQLLEVARAAGRPVVFTTATPFAELHYGGVVRRSPSLAKTPGVMSRPGAIDIPEEIAPLPGELVLQKPKASAFFNTSLVSYLIREGVDSLLVCGTTTSGCLRATAVDGFSWGYPTYIVEEASFDRSRLSHAVNLFDMHTKYAAVISAGEAMAWLESTRS